MESDIINTCINTKAATLAARALWVFIWMAPVPLEEQTCSCWSSTLRSKNPPVKCTLKIFPSACNSCDSEYLI